MTSSADRPLSCFKAYDVRGKVPQELDEALAEKIGRAYAAEIHPDGAVAVGRDIRETSDCLAQSVMRGLTKSGVDAKDIGLCGTEMVYYAASQPGMAGGIMVTASHNPIEYNGIKMVRENSKPIGLDTGLMAIERRARLGDFANKGGTGQIERIDVMDGYIQCLLGFINRESLKPLKIVVNAGNGCAGPVFDRLASFLPFNVVRVHHEPDGTFPNGIPNPMLPENRAATADAVVKENADFGVAWDGDFDRCFLFDDHGGFVEGYYIVGLLAERMLQKHPGSAIVYDPRMVWNTIDIVERHGGRPVCCRTGHSFIKAVMRCENAVYGGEMSAHHYFRDFFFCDSGMIPWLLIAEAVSETGKSLSELVGECQRRFPCSGEINRRVTNPDSIIERLRTFDAEQNPELDETDGISLSYPNWRFNVRKSNTEPILRLNVETRGDEKLLKVKTEELLRLIDSA